MNIINTIKSTDFLNEIKWSVCAGGSLMLYFGTLNDLVIITLFGVILFYLFALIQFILDKRVSKSKSELSDDKITKLLQN